MNLTVSDLIAELQRYPATMPVKIECSKTWLDDGLYCGNADSTEVSDATDVRFNGNHILIGCDD